MHVDYHIYMYNTPKEIFKGNVSRGSGGMTPGVILWTKAILVGGQGGTTPGVVRTKAHK